MWNEDEILNRCLKGERKAQRMLYEKYAPLLLGVCTRFTGNRTEAEDVLQEAFVKIFLNIKDFTKTGSLTGWMRRIVLNTAITLYHRNKKHRDHYDVDAMKDRTPGGDDASELEFTREEMMKVITELPAGYRMVFNLYAMEGYKHKEIAKEMGIDINTSKSQYSRAKKIIRHKLLNLKKEMKKR